MWVRVVICNKEKATSHKTKQMRFPESSKQVTVYFKKHVFLLFKAL